MKLDLSAVRRGRTRARNTLARVGDQTHALTVTLGPFSATLLPPRQVHQHAASSPEEREPGASSPSTLETTTLHVKALPRPGAPRRP